MCQARSRVCFNSGHDLTAAAARSSSVRVFDRIGSTPTSSRAHDDALTVGRPIADR
jgi:hypothetical protein